MKTRRQFGKWVLKGGLLIPFIAPAVARSATILIHGPRINSAVPQYYYPFSFDSTSFTSSQSGIVGYHVGAPVIAGATGTCTKIGCRLQDIDSITNFIVCLYSNAGALLAGTTGATDGSFAAKWYDVTISQAVVASTTYRILFSVDDNDTLEYGAAGQDGYYTEDDYSGTCVSSPTFNADTGFCHSVRLFV